jgi:glutamyl-tRNA synthetase/glutamyl-Q tRNA(Asp) synthetase
MRLTRFAPAPTGLLHLGHVASAIYVWGFAKALGAGVLLRIEDHDAERCRPEYERTLLDDLDWLGFEPARFPTRAFRAGACESRQSDRTAIYLETARDLIARGLVYGCTCSRQQIADAAPAGSDGERRYPGTCRDRGTPPEAGVAWRLRLDPGQESFADLLAGPQAQNPAVQCGDVVIRDRLGNWTCHFVASVDDHRQGIDLVVRGRDLLASTGRQIRIARLTGREHPAVFAHHDLVMKTTDQKLSKSDRDTGVSELRAAGWTAERRRRGGARWDSPRARSCPRARRSICWRRLPQLQVDRERRVVRHRQHRAEPRRRPLGRAAARIEDHAEIRIHRAGGRRRHEVTLTEDREAIRERIAGPRRIRHPLDRGSFEAVDVVVAETRPTQRCAPSRHARRREPDDLADGSSRNGVPARSPSSPITFVNQAPIS